MLMAWKRVAGIFVDRSTGHRGAIKIYSELKRGTTFKVLFPCAEIGNGQQAATPATGTLWRGSGTVLVVDDEEYSRATANRMLELHGFDVILAPDGREALDVFRQNPDRITAVLLDLTMPHMGGEELFRQLGSVAEEVSRTATCPVASVRGHVQVFEEESLQDTEQAVELGSGD